MDKVLNRQSPSKLQVQKVRFKKTKFPKNTHALPRIDRDWPRVVAIEVMQLFGDNVCAKFGFFKENVKKVVTSSSKSQIYKHITHFQDNSIISVKLHFVQFGFLLRSGHGPIYGGGGEEENPS